MRDRLAFRSIKIAPLALSANETAVLGSQLVRIRPGYFTDFKTVRGRF